MRHARCLLRLAAALVAIATVAGAAAHPENPNLNKFPPGITSTTDVRYYDVHGRTAQEIVKAMRELGAETNGFFGHSRSNYHWTWRTKNDRGGRCALTSVQVIMVSQIALPRWTPPADTVPGVYPEWQRFMSALETHEIGHKDISGRAARDILERMSAMRTLCTDVPREVKRLTDSIIAQSQERQLAYDLMTRHGATQGAIFTVRRP